MSIPQIVLTTIVGYFALLFVISWAASRRTDDSVALTGGHNAPWWVVAIAMIGAPISGVTFISVPGYVIGSQYSYMQMVLGFAVGYLVIAYWLVPLFYKRHLVSIYGYLEDRFGGHTHKTGAWFFFVSKMLGAAVRFLVVCASLQLLVFEPLHVPFAANIVVTIVLIFLYTLQGGVKTVIWTDTLKSLCLILSVVLCIVFVWRGVGGGSMVGRIADSGTARMFFFDDPSSEKYFWKQFLAGIFMVIAMTGLDQDLMQRTLASKNAAESRKGLVVSGITQVGVVALFLVLGSLLVLYTQARGIALPEKADTLFSLVAWDGGMPVAVGVLFVLGLVSAGYSAAGSALTALTNSFLVDIAGVPASQFGQLGAKRRLVHVGMAVCMGVIIYLFYCLNNDSAIKLVYALASYTYGPILGLFAYGMMCKGRVRDRLVPVVCIMSPALSWVLQWGMKAWCGYTIGFELLLYNAAFTIVGLCLLRLPGRQNQAETAK